MMPLSSRDPRLWERHDEVAAKASLPQLRNQLVRDVPGEQERELRLIGEEALLIENRDERSGNVLPDLVRPLDLEDALENAVVEADVVDERARARRRADSVHTIAAGSHVAQQSEQPQLRRDDGLAKRLQPVRVERNELRGEKLAHGLAHRVAPAARGVHPYRAAVSRDALRVDDLEVVHRQQVPQARQRVVTEALVVDRVVLERLEQRDPIVGFADEEAVVVQK